jgi:hypothetical protein
MYHLKMFNPEALNRQAKAKWNAATREADSETDMELSNLLAEDDDLNFTNEPTLEKPSTDTLKEGDPVVTMNIPSFPSEHMPAMTQDADSISTFHPGKVVNPGDENEPDMVDNHRKPNRQEMPASILKSSKHSDYDGMSKMSMSESASRISSLETELSTMNRNFQGAIEQLQSQANNQALAQAHQSILLEEIIKMLKLNNISSIKDPSITPPSPSEAANHPQTPSAGDSSGVAGHG